MIEKDKVLRQLLRNYLAEPDPQRWLVASDRLEELGRDEEAERWRQRAKHFGPLLTLVKKHAWGFQMSASDRYFIGPWSFQFRRRHKMLRLWGLAYWTRTPRPEIGDSGGTLHIARSCPARRVEGDWRIFTIQGTRLFHEKCIWVIDTLTSCHSPKAVPAK